MELKGTGCDRGVDSSGLGYGRMANSCERGTDVWFPYRAGNILGSLCLCLLMLFRKYTGEGSNSLLFFRFVFIFLSLPPFLFRFLIISCLLLFFFLCSFSSFLAEGCLLSGPLDRPSISCTGTTYQSHLKGCTCLYYTESLLYSVSN